MSDQRTKRRITLECPQCGARLEGTVNDPAKPVALAVYGGVPGGRGESDAEVLTNIAAWLDKIDDAAEGEMAAAGKDPEVGRTIQADLRRIAARLLS